MALSLITEGNASSPNDLNQVVNLLNGTTTNTPVTLNGGFSSALAGQAARVVGGAPSYGPTTNNPGVIVVDPAAGLPYTYQQGDIGLSNGALMVGGTANTFLGGVNQSQLPSYWNPIGCGGYVARMHLSGTVSATAQSQYITMDTVDFDPRGMVQPFQGPGGGLAITVPTNGAFAFVGAIRGKGVNSANVGFQLAWWTPGGSFAVLCTQTTLQSSSSSSDYTGGSAAYVIFNSKGHQLAFQTMGGPRMNFQIDNTDSSRTYIAAWVPN